MRRRWIVALVSFVWVLLPSCVEVEVRLRLGADGRGQQQVELRIPDRVATALAHTGSPALPALDEREVRALAESAGMKLRSFRDERSNGERRVSWVVDCATLRDLGAARSIAGGAEWYLLAGSAPGSARLVCYPQGFARWQAGRRDPGAVPARADLAARAPRRQQLGGIEVQLRIELPGDVVSCSPNLEQRAARVVIARVRVGDVASAADVALALAQRYEVEFEAGACVLPLDGTEPALAGRARSATASR